MKDKQWWIAKKVLWKQWGRHHNSSNVVVWWRWRRVRSQALLGQRGGHLVSQRGELRRVGHVDAAGGGHGAELLVGVFQRDDLSAVVSAGPGCLAEAQFVALNLGSDHRWRSHMNHLTTGWWDVVERPLVGNSMYTNVLNDALDATKAAGSQNGPQNLQVHSVPLGFCS